MEIQKTTTYKITPDDRGGVNEMTLTYTQGEVLIGSRYEIHAWNDSLDELAGRLERMAMAIRAFKPTH